MFIRPIILFIPLIFSLVFSSCQSSQNKPNRLRLNLYCEPPSLDSRKVTDLTSVNALVMLFEGLTRLGEDHKPYPALARTIHISQDQKVYTFKLREAHWSNGDRVTAQDFVYTWRKMVDPTFPAPLAYKLFIIQNAEAIKQRELPIESLGVEALDENRLRVCLNHPTPYFLELLSLPFFFPVHQQTDELYPLWAGEAGEHFVTNGPYSLKKWEHESEMVLEKNPNYWDACSVRIDSIHLAMINDSTTEFYMYEMDELDWAGSPFSAISPEFVPTLIETGEVKQLPAMAVYYYKINTEVFPLDNTNIRKALSLAVSRRAIVDHILQAGQTVATSIVPPLLRSNCEEQLFQDHDYSKAQALFEQGLKESGIDRDGFPTLTLSYNVSRDHQKIAQAIQQNWKELLGISVELESCDWKVYLAKLNRKDYQIARMGWVGDFQDPFSFLEPYRQKDDPNVGGNNGTGWEHPYFATLLDKSERETDSQKRVEYLNEAEQLLISEMPIIPLYYVNYCYLQNPQLKNVFLSPLGIIDFKQAYFEK